MELFELLRLLSEDVNRATAQSNQEAIAEITRKMLEQQQIISEFLDALRMLLPIVAIGILLLIILDVRHKYRLEKRIEKLERVISNTNIDIAQSASI